MLTLICGLPRAGKTTYAEQFDNVIHLDTSGAYNGVLNRLKCKSGDIIIEGVYHQAKQRKQIIQTYNGEGFKCIWINTPKEIRQKRKGYDKFCDFPFEPPTYKQGWDQIIIIENDKETILDKEE